jgi:glutathione synthase/RimK-type ligase-like ATP-grasp enzyme
LKRAIRATSKLYLEEFPEKIRPRSLVTRDPETIELFVADGMFLVGIDVIGDKVMEINAESPGGCKPSRGSTRCRLLHRHRSTEAPHRLGS